MRITFSINKRDALAALVLCLLGLAAVLQVSAHSVASVSGMGAGVLPVLLGALLMFVGVMWLFDSRLSPDDDEGVDIGVSKWRGCCGVVSGVFAFMILGKYAGLAPAVFALVFIAVLGDRGHSWRSALALALAATVATAAAHTWLLDVPMPLLGWK